MRHDETFAAGFTAVERSSRDANVRRGVSSAKNHVLEELHVSMNRMCISTWVNVIFYIMMFVFGFRVLFQSMLFFSLFFSDLG